MALAKAEEPAGDPEPAAPRPAGTNISCHKICGERSMNQDVIISCAITGAGDTVDKHPAIPVTPEQIAASAIEATKEIGRAHV